MIAPKGGGHDPGREAVLRPLLHQLQHLGSQHDGRGSVRSVSGTAAVQPQAEDLGHHTSVRRGTEQPARDGHALADEARDHLGRRPGIEVARRGELLDDAGVHHGHPVGQGHGLGLVVRNVDHRRPGLPMQATELGLHLLTQMSVEIGERLVEQNQRGIGGETARQGDPLALPAGQRLRPAVGQVVEAHLGQAGAHLRLPAGRGQAAQLEGVAHVLRHAHVRPERVGLKHHGDLARLRRQASLGRGDGLATQPDLSGVGCLEASDETQQGGLAAARRT